MTIKVNRKRIIGTVLLLLALLELIVIKTTQTSQGVIEIRLNGAAYTVAGWIVIAGLGLCLTAAMLENELGVLSWIAIGCLAAGLFQDQLTPAQTGLWYWGAGAALVGIGLNFAYTQLRHYRNCQERVHNRGHAREL